MPSVNRCRVALLATSEWPPMAAPAPVSCSLSPAVRCVRMLIRPHRHRAACDCNNRGASCDPVSGICAGCSGNSYGDHCELCNPGFWRDSLAGGICRACQCGGFSTTCHATTGVCSSCTGNRGGAFCTWLIFLFFVPLTRPSRSCYSIITCPGVLQASSASLATSSPTAIASVRGQNPSRTFSVFVGFSLDSRSVVCPYMQLAAATENRRRAMPLRVRPSPEHDLLLRPQLCFS
jgi:hypothetical protein